MPDITILDTGHVYRNPEPLRMKRNASFPTLVRLPNGELLCAMDIGASMDSLDRRSYLSRSTDGGVTWTEPVQMFEPPKSAHPTDASARISRLPNGDLVGLVCLFDRRRTKAGHSNPDTEGFVETELAIIRSKDQGRIWSVPQPIHPPINWQHFEICSPFVVLPSGRLLAPTSILNDWDGDCRFPRYSAILLASDDSGNTWPHVVSVMALSRENLTGWEQKQTILSDGRVMAVCWCFDHIQKKSMRNRYTFSSDNGDSFLPSIESPIHGETNTILALPDNYLFSVYRRVDRQGLWAHLARVEGDHWKSLADCPLWGKDVKSYQNDAPGAGVDGVWKRMRTLQFGCPTLVHLSEQEILTAFWGVEENDVSVIRWYRLRWTC